MLAKLWAGQAQLLQVVDARDPTGRFAHPLNGGQGQGDQDGNDGNHHEQFDQGKSAIGKRMHGLRESMVVPFISQRARCSTNGNVSDPTRNTANFFIAVDNSISRKSVWPGRERRNRDDGASRNPVHDSLSAVFFVRTGILEGENQGTK